MNPSKKKTPVRKQQQALVEEPVRFLCAVDVDDLVRWISKVFKSEEWHKNSHTPYVRVDPAWYDWIPKTYDVVGQVLKHFPDGCTVTGRALSVVHPGDYVPPHTDNTAVNWVTRVHVPLVTNLDAHYISGGKNYHLGVGNAYQVDISVPHAIRNNGNESRIHLMFDVVK